MPPLNTKQQLVIGGAIIQIMIMNSPLMGIATCLEAFEVRMDFQQLQSNHAGYSIAILIGIFIDNCLIFLLRSL